MARVNRASQPVDTATRKRGRPARPPSTRNCAIYERIRLEGENHEKVAADYAMSRQCVADIVARVESWLGAHPAHKLAQKMRVRCGKRWETLWTWAIDSFDRSRRNREFKKERTARRAAGEAELVVTEQTVREQNGDPRYLNIAWRVAVREDRLWMPAESGRQPPQNAEAACRAGDVPPAVEGEGGLARLPGAGSSRLAYLPAGLCDLAHLACGLGGDSAPVSTLFERRCAEAFRCLGFEVRELGQGCGRTADCLAVAAAERFAVIIDAKVRRRGYTLGTDDRQFCEYATRHTRELAQSGVERVYFAVVGRGFRQADLDKLAGFMTGTPIRSVVFIEVEALMRLVNDSIRRRREFRLAEIDQLLFGNKILES